jgi:hypothetical protein
MALDVLKCAMGWLKTLIRIKRNPETESLTMKIITRIALVAVMTSLLSGCFLTKLVTTPMRLVGASASVAGAALSIFPVVGNEMDEALERVDAAIDRVADRIDDIPI